MPAATRSSPCRSKASNASVVRGPKSLPRRIAVPIRSWRGSGAARAGPMSFPRFWSARATTTLSAARARDAPRSHAVPEAVASASWIRSTRATAPTWRWRPIPTAYPRPRASSPPLTRSPAGIPWSPPLTRDAGGHDVACANADPHAVSLEGPLAARADADQRVDVGPSVRGGYGVGDEERGGVDGDGVGTEPRKPERGVEA